MSFCYGRRRARVLNCDHICSEAARPGDLRLAVERVLGLLGWAVSVSTGCGLGNSLLLLQSSQNQGKAFWWLVHSSLWLYFFWKEVSTQKTIGFVGDYKRDDSNKTFVWFKVPRIRSKDKSQDWEKIIPMYMTEKKGPVPPSCFMRKRAFKIDLGKEFEQRKQSKHGGKHEKLCSSIYD